MYYVYALIDPINNIPFYIGKGKGDRAYQHLNGQDKQNAKKVKMINNIRMLGHEPIVAFIVKDLDDEKLAYQFESICIKNFKLLTGAELTNRIGVDLRPPSFEGKKHTEEVKRRISAAKLGRPMGPLSDDHKRNVSMALKGKKKPLRSEDHKSKYAKEFVITFPDGHTETILNLKKFCVDHNLNRSKMHYVSSGKRSHHKGYSIRQTNEIAAYDNNENDTRSNGDTKCKVSNGS